MLKRWWIVLCLLGADQALATQLCSSAQSDQVILSYEEYPVFADLPQCEPDVAASLSASENPTGDGSFTRYTMAWAWTEAPFPEHWHIDRIELNEHNSNTSTDVIHTFAPNQTSLTFNPSLTELNTFVYRVRACGVNRHGQEQCGAWLPADTDPGVTVNVVPNVAIGAFSVDQTSVFENQSVTLSWQTLAASSCSASGGTGTWPGSTINLPNGSKTITLTTPGDYDFTLSCQNSGGSISQTVSVQVRPVAITISQFSASAAEVDEGQPFTLNWTVDNADSCTPQQGNSTWLNTNITLDSGQSGNLMEGAYGRKTYALDCSNAGGGAATASTEVVVVKPDTPGNPEAVPGVDSGTAYQATQSEKDLNATAGITAGQFRVDESGNATYSIPILTAPGSGGVAPEVSLNYSSQGANGHLGVGWSLGGLSVITRCSQTLEQDGASARRGVYFDSDDRFCLDGQRLMLESGGYGAANSTYRTEIDNFTKVVAKGVQGVGPEHFIVYRRDGSVSTYGKTTDSRNGIGGTINSVFSWALDQVADSAGNTIDYEYTEQQSSLEFYLSAVRYTGNTNNTATTTDDIAPFATISFVYESRSDESAGYIRGSKLATTKRLKRIDSKAKITSSGSEQWLRSYHLTYGADGHGRSMLTQVKACSDSNAAKCFQPVTFGWQESQNSIGAAAQSYMPSTSGPFAASLRSALPADINGDGLVDFVWHESNSEFTTHKLYYTLSQPYGSVSQFANQQLILQLPDNVIPDPEVGVEPGWTAIDYDADGYTDIVYAGSDGNWKGLRWNRQSGGFQTAQNLGSVPTSAGSFVTDLRAGDYNGDGAVDLLFATVQEFTSGGALYLALNDRDSEPFSTTTSPAISPDVTIPSDPLYNDYFGPIINFKRGIRVFDYNADGAVDLLVRVKAGYCTDGSGQSHAQYGSDAPEGVCFGTYDAWHVLLSDGQGDFTEDRLLANAGCTDTAAFPVCSTVEYAKQLHLADFNADGVIDLFYQGLNNDWAYQINTGDSSSGNGLLAKTTLPQLVLADDDLAEHVQTVDFDGDGDSDVLYPENGTDTAKFKLIRWTGDSFAASAENTQVMAGQTDYDNDRTIFADADGDGYLDALWFNRNDLGENLVSIELQSGANSLAGQAPVAINAVESITDGLGATTSLTYRPLTDPAVYTRMDNAAAIGNSWGAGSVVYDFIAPLLVVHTTSHDSPAFANSVQLSGGTTLPNHSRTHEYHYVGAKLQGGGRGFLGFAEIVSYDQEKDIRSNTRYRQDFPYTGLPYDTLQVVPNTTANQLVPISAVGSTAAPSWGPVGSNTTYIANAYGSKLSYAVNEWQQQATVGGSVFPYIADSMEVARTLDGALSHRVFTSNTYGDSYGNATQVQIKTYEGDSGTALSTVTTNNTYTNNTAKWHLGRLTNATVTHARVGESTITRESSFAYHSANGILTQEVIEPNGTTADKQRWKVTTGYTLDRWGNRISTTVTGYGMTARTATAEYDALGRFVTQAKNAFNQITEQLLSWDQYGNPLTLKDAHGTQVVNSYDVMGRLLTSQSDSGAHSKTLLRLGAYAQCPSATVSYTLSYQSGVVNTAGQAQIAALSCADKLGRTIREATRSFSGSWIYQDIAYDTAGRVARSSEPYFSGQTAYWTATAYDRLDRPLRVRYPTTQSDWFSYDENINGGSAPRRVILTNQLNQERIEQKNALGEVVWVQDDLGSQLDYSYDAVGNLTVLDGVKAGPDDQVETIYDAKGYFKIAMQDPDKGNWEYAYNPLGELTRQRDDKQQATDFVYDQLGRVSERKDLSNVSSLSDTSVTTLATATMTYQTAATAPDGDLGQLLSETLSEGGTLVHQRDYDYDGYGRLKQLDTSIDGKTYTQRTTYDQYGRVFQQFDVSGGDRGVRNVYNNWGHLQQVKESRDGASGAVYQAITAMDQRGNITGFELGGGEIVASVVYNAATGHLASIHADNDSGTSLQDNDYVFNALGNLTQRHTQLSNHKELFTYDSLNRLTEVKHSSNGGSSYTISQTLRYNAAGDMLCKSGINGTSGSACNGSTTTHEYLASQNHAASKVGTVTYQYDLNGNNTSSSDGRSITYTSFDKASRVEKGNIATDFIYGIDRGRIQRVDQSSGQTTKTTLYLGNVELVDDGTNRIYKRHIGGAAIVDLYVISKLSTVYYLLQDHLGSTEVITDDQGQNPDFLSYDAWGSRRAGLDWLDFSVDSTLINAKTNKGFTGHEMVDSLGIIHMGGRIYDPIMGRFLQADPVVQAPKNTQNLNRYSYVLNNPLSYTDPTGFRFTKRYGRAIAAIAIAITTQYYIGVFKLAGSQAVLASMGGGALAGQISTGNSRGLLAGAFSGAAFAGLNSVDPGTLGEVFGNAIIGGISAEIEGGSFGHAFVVAGVTALAKTDIGDIGIGSKAAKHIAARVAATAMVSGFISAASGGKFANGAVTGAFQQAFGEAVSSRDSESRDLTEVNVRDMTDAEFESVFGTSDEWLVYESLATMQMEHMQRMYLKGQISETELKEFRVAQGQAALLGVGGVGLGLAVKAVVPVVSRTIFRRLFGKGALLNRGPNFRIGIGRKGGESVFRVGGKVVKKITGRDHVDLWKRGSLNK